MGAGYFRYSASLFFYQRDNTEEIPQNMLINILKRLEERFYEVFDERSFNAFVEPMGCRYANGNDPTEVSEQVQAFLAHSKQQTLLIQGAPGLGKTLLSQVQAHYRWQQLNQFSGNLSLALWIWLPAILKESQGQDLLKIFLKKQGLSTSEIETIQQANQKGILSIQLMLDGWDEVPVQDIELFTHNGWWDKTWPHIKLIVTSRPEILNQYAGKYPGGYPSFFCQGNMHDGRFIECYLQPFNPEQINSYLGNYLKNTLGLDDIVILPQPKEPNVNAILCWQEVATYEHYIDKLPGVAALAQVPFVLTLLAQVLPRIVLETQGKNISEESDKANQQALTHDTLYSYFTQQWLHQQVNRLWNNPEVKEKLNHALEIPVDENIDDITGYKCERLKYCLRIYSENLAKAAFNLGQGKLDVLLDDIVTLNPDLVQSDNQEKPFFKASLLKPELIKIIRSGCLLKSQEAGKHVFLHKTLLEFFAAQRLHRSVCTAIDWYVGNLSEEIITEEFSLNGYSLNQEPKIISFLAEKVIADDAFKKNLYQVIEYSKQEAVIATASSNAITILNTAREDFTNKNFSGVRIPGANLTSALCSGTNFSNADCRGVNFSGAWLRDADLSGAYLAQIRFGELTPISMKTAIASFAQSPDERWLALGDMCSNVIIWDMEQEQIHGRYAIPLTRMAQKYAAFWTGFLEGVEGFVSLAIKALAFSVDSKNLLVVNANHMLYLINLSTNEMKQKFSLLPFKKTSDSNESFENELLHDAFNSVKNEELSFCLSHLITTSSDMLYTHSQLDTYYYIQSNGEHWEPFFCDEIFLCMSQDGTHCLTYHLERHQQVLWDVGSGFNKRQEIRAIFWTENAFSDKPNHITISRDNQGWVFLSFDKENELDRGKVNHCLQWVSKNNPSPQSLSHLGFAKSDEISFTFGAAVDTLAIYSGKHMGLWDLTSQKNLQIFYLPINKYFYLWFSQCCNQLFCFEPGVRQLLRYDLRTLATSIGNITKSKLLKASWHGLVRDTLVVDTLDEKNISCRVGQQNIVFPNLNHFLFHHLSISKIYEVFSCAALSDVYAALPYGYWSFNNSTIINEFYAQGKGYLNTFRKLTILLINKEDGEKFFQKTDVILCLRKHPSVSLTLTYPTPIVALSFSRDSCYLAGLDGTLSIVLWELSIVNSELEPPRVKATCVWRISSGFSRNTNWSNATLAFDKKDEFDEFVVDIAVQQQGIVVAYDLQILSLLYTKKKKPISVMYSVGLSFSNLNFMDDTTLVCETKNKDLVVFRLLQMNKDYRLSLIYSSERLPLQLQNCNVAGALGVTPSQRSLFEHHKTTGQPASLDIENNAVLATTFAQGQWLSQIKATKAVISQSFYSQLLKGTLIDYDSWVVTLVRDVNAKDGMHTFLLIEGITNFGKACYVRMDLANRIGDKKVEPAGHAKIKFSYAVAKNLTEQLLQDTLSSDKVLRRNPEGLKGQAWVVSRRQLVVLIEHIQQTYVMPDKTIPYSTVGDRSFFAKGHNCYTWAREMLLRLEHPGIKKKLPKQWKNYIINNPGFDLTERLVKEPKVQEAKFALSSG